MAQKRLVTGSREFGKNLSRGLSNFVVVVVVLCNLPMISVSRAKLTNPHSDDA
jgi:hypothetical protein